MDSANDHPLTPERLIGDLRLVIDTAEELLRNTSQYTGTPYEEARSRLAQALRVATGELERSENARLERMMAATSAASELHADAGGEARLMRAFRPR